MSIEQLFEPISVKEFAMTIEEDGKTVFYPSTRAVEEALEKSMA